MHLTITDFDVATQNLWFNLRHFDLRDGRGLTLGRRGTPDNGKLDRFRVDQSLLRDKSSEGRKRFFFEKKNQKTFEN